MPSARQPISIPVRRMVQEGIRDFQRRHPHVVVERRAKAILLARAAKHEERILGSFKSGKKTPKEFVKGLQQMLTYAVHAARSVRIRENFTHGSMRRRQAHYVDSIRGEATWQAYQSLARSRFEEVVISPEDVAVAMKKKCKTFPWC